MTMIGAQLSTTSVNFQPYTNDMMMEEMKETMRYVNTPSFSPMPSFILSKSLQRHDKFWLHSLIHKLLNINIWQYLLPRSELSIISKSRFRSKHTFIKFCVDYLVFGYRINHQPWTFWLSVQMLQNLINETVHNKNKTGLWHMIFNLNFCRMNFHPIKYSSRE